MIRKMQGTTMRVETSVDTQTGEILASYLGVRAGKVAKTLEFADGCAFADYDRKGNLLGIELLAPCEIKVLDKIAKKESANIKKGLRTSMPCGMVLAKA